MKIKNIYLALDDNDAALVVHTHAPRVLENVGAKLPNKLSVLVVDLNLMRGRPAEHKNISVVQKY